MSYISENKASDQACWKKSSKWPKILCNMEWTSMSHKHPNRFKIQFNAYAQWWYTTGFHQSAFTGVKQKLKKIVVLYGVPTGVRNRSPLLGSRLRAVVTCVPSWLDGSCGRAFAFVTCRSPLGSEIQLKKKKRPPVARLPSCPFFPRSDLSSLGGPNSAH